MTLLPRLARILVLALIVSFAVSIVTNLALAATTGQNSSNPPAVTQENSDGEDDKDSSQDSQDSSHDDHDHSNEDTRRGKRGESPGLIANLMTLAMLVLLQAVLGFDNLLYISLESKNVAASEQSKVRAWGIGLAIFFRIGLLFALFYSREFFESTVLFSCDYDYLKVKGNIHSLITLGGGAFIIYTAMKEIWHMTRLEHDDHGHGKGKKEKTVATAIFWIVVMNLVFSFDSILSAMALSEVLWVMTAAIIISGLMMIVLADRVSDFLQKNRMYEVLGLFVLLVVGIMLVTEGGHLAHLTLFGEEVMPMTKTTFYFVLAVMLLTDIAQSQYQKKLLAQQKLENGEAS